MEERRKSICKRISRAEAHRIFLEKQYVKELAEAEERRILAEKHSEKELAEIEERKLQVSYKQKNADLLQRNVDWQLRS